MDQTYKFGGKMLKNLVFVLVIGLLVFAAACSPAAAPVDPDLGPDRPVSPETPGGDIGAPAAPQPGDENMQRGNVFIDDIEILTLESFPPQFNVIIRGNLPTPCHQLRTLVNEPDAQNRMDIEVFSLVNPDEMCIQVLAPFEEVVFLGSLPDGSYTVLVNGQPAGEITTP
jgi:hypothetical protein